MKGRGLIWLIVCGAGLVLLMILSAPSDLDTRIRLEREGNAPFDAEVFYASLPEWLGTTVTPVDEPPYLFLADTTRTGTTYLFLTRAFAPDDDESQRLLDYVARGNTVVVSAHVLDGAFFDELGTQDSTYDGLQGVRTEWQDDLFWLQRNSLIEDDTLALDARGLSGAYGFPFPVNRATLYGLDSTRTERLGGTYTGSAGVLGDPNLARIRHGRGSVVVHTAPLALTNAALTGEGDAEAYIGGLLAALPSQPVFWDDYVKPYRSQAQTPLRYVLQTPALAWAYWLGLLLILLLILFRGRRWQRAIPVVRPPPNAQREFARTVGRLHFTHGDTRALFDRKKRVFLDRLRTRLRMPSPDLTEQTARRAARRAGVTQEEAVALFAMLRRLDRTSRPAPTDMVDVDARMDRFFRQFTAPTAQTPEASGVPAAAQPASGDGATTPEPVSPQARP